MPQRHTFDGSCHCGAISFSFHTATPEEEIAPRACQCSLCRSHGASWISDPAGAAELVFAAGQDVSFYRFGTGTADFIVCKRCGVLVAALCEIDGVTRGVFNARAMPGHGFRSPAVLTDFDGETIDDRLSRRKRNWTGRVTVAGAMTEHSKGRDGPKRG